MCFQHAAEFQLTIGPHYRIRVDRKINRELPDSGELVAGSQRPRGDSSAYLIDELAVDRDTCMQVKRESKWLAALSTVSHASQRTIELVQYVKYFFLGGEQQLFGSCGYMVKKWANSVISTQTVTVGANETKEISFVFKSM